MPEATKPLAPEDRLRALQGQLIAVIRANSPDLAVWIGQCLINAGLRCLEITYTIPDTLSVLDTLKQEKENQPSIHIGVGSVKTGLQLNKALEAGASFIASPHCDPKLISQAKEADRLILPGVMTPTEIQLALNAGASCVKLFPAKPLGGASFVKAIRGPFPEVAMIPFGGLGLADFQPCLKAGALAMGMGGSLLPTQEEQEALDSTAYSERVSQQLQAIVS